jgi:prevent-host-death family protein
MRTVNVHDAKTNLSRLLEEVESGRDVVIARSGTPVARLVPIKKRGPRRLFGRDRGKFIVPEDFDAPLPPEVLADFER